jgi:polyisoprenoid-binding protein YceI
VPTQATGIPAELPESGEVSFQLTGDLTIRDVTREVVWDVTGNLEGDVLTGQAATSFTFEDFNLTQPRVSMVLSVEDTIRLEMDFTMQRTGG